MKKIGILLPLCLVAASCSFSLASFSEIPEAKRDSRTASYISAKKEAAKTMPNVFTFTITKTQGTEEGRNPLFGRIIYKEGAKAYTKNILSLQKDAFYMRERTIVNDGKKEQSIDSLIYVRGSSIIFYNTGIDESTYITEYKYRTKYQASNDWIDKVIPMAETVFASMVEQFDEDFDKIPSYYNPEKAAEELQSYRAFERPNFASDYKLELNEFFSEDKTLGRAYYTAVTNDYLPYYFRSVNRQRTAGVYKVAEVEMSVDKSVTLERPRYTSVNQEISTSYSSESSSSANSSK